MAVVHPASGEQPRRETFGMVLSDVSVGQHHLGPELPVLNMRALSRDQLRLAETIFHRFQNWEAAGRRRATTGGRRAEPGIRPMRRPHPPQPTAPPARLARRRPHRHRQPGLPLRNHHRELQEHNLEREKPGKPVPAPDLPPAPPRNAPGSGAGLLQSVVPVFCHTPNYNVWTGTHRDR